METYAKCPALRVCGHCPLMEHPYHKQLELQSTYLRTQFAELTSCVGPVIGMQQMEGFLHYVEVHFGLDWRGKFASGLISTRQNQFIALRACMLRHPLAERILRSINRLASTHGIDTSFPATKLTLRIRSNQEQVLLCFTHPERIDATFSSFLYALRREHSEIFGIVLRDGESKPSTFWGRPAIEDSLCSLKFSLPPSSDFPSCPSQAEVLYMKAMELAQVQDGDIVIDCCTTHGVLTLLSMKGGASRSYLLQEHTPYCDEAALNGIEHVERFVGNNEKHLRQLAKRGQRCNTLFLSPSEEGCERSLLDSVLTIKPERIIYLSKQERTLKRDLQYLVQRGFYQVEVIQGVDMHPHSAHLHVIASLKHVLAIRPLWRREYPLIGHFLYEAIYVAEGEAPPPLSILEDPSLSHYIQEFGRVGDYALAAEVHDKVVGVVWVRLFDPQDPGYGYFTSETPELCIAIEEPFRNRGLGRQLIEEMCKVLLHAGYEKVSLSVQKESRAYMLYQSLGFLVAEERGDAYVMVRFLQGERG
ncbi:MAG: GNAT family N-acetyltransferase [Sphaerochaetaceae bacterium]|nr:GNAT family N-acetyltransferase [Sphaerochaetaceae bacterium]